MEGKRNRVGRRLPSKGDRAYKMEKDISIAIVVVFPFLMFMMVLLFCSFVFEHGNLTGALCSMLMITASTWAFFDANRTLIDQSRTGH